MKAMGSVRKELFDELHMSDSQKEMLELTKLSDEDLYRKIGMAAKASATVNDWIMAQEKQGSGDVRGRTSRR